MTEVTSNPEQSSRPMVKVLVALLCVVAIAAGVAIWWMSQRGKEERAYVEGFIEAIQAGDFNKARSMCTQDVADAELKVYTDAGPNWGRVIGGITLYALSREPGVTEVSGKLEFENAPHHFNATVVKGSDGQFKITWFSFN